MNLFFKQRSRAFFAIIFIIMTNFILNNDDESALKSYTEDVFNYLWPMPSNMTKGVDSFIVSPICKFTFQLNVLPLTNDLTQTIIGIYDKLININNHNTKNMKYWSVSPECKTPIQIVIKNEKMIKYNDEYTTDIESYILKISEGQFYLESLYLNGLLRGLETLSQILIRTDKGIEIYNTPLIIYDKPYYTYRGVMIDSSRHFIPKYKIKEIIDGMLYSKLNVLHWHITDDEYFGFGSDLIKNKTKPNREADYIYGKSDMREIVQYAFIRGVTIIPEIDNPSHTRSWKLINETVVLRANETAALDPSIPESFQIVKTLIGEALEIFSDGPSDYMHLGGDEVEKQMWDTPQIKQFMQNNNLDSVVQLENYYFNQVRSILPEDKTYLYWVTNEKEFDIYNKPNTVLFYWGYHSELKKYIDGFSDLSIKRRMVVASADYLYLDCGVGNKYGDTTWCGGYKTFKDIYKLPIQEFTSYKNFTIIGSEIVLFGELADEYSIIGKIFPRACAFSEKVWTPQQLHGNIFLRLLSHNKRLKARGVGTISFTTQLCENEPILCINKFAN